MIVIAQKAGQLANRIWLFSHLVAFGETFDVKIANPSFDEYAPFFESTRADPFCRYPRRASRLPGGATFRRVIYRAIWMITRMLTRLPFSIPRLDVVALANDEEHLDLRDPEFLHKTTRGSIVLLRGWLFRDAKSFQTHADLIRSFFRPTRYHRERISRKVREAREEADILIGVHVRQGDFKQWKGGLYHFESPEYVRLIQNIQSLFVDKTVRFLVCSNVSQDARLFDRVPVSFGTGHSVEDLYSLAECDYLVGPPSTYTMWASFYGDVPLHIMQAPDEPISMEDFTVYADYG